MRRPFVALLLLALALVAPSLPRDHPAPADAQTAAISRRGTLGGAPYRIEAPADWRGGLVVFAHGIQRGHLIAWIERGVRPDGEDVLADDLSRIGLKWTPALHVEDPLARRG
jgi:hypothetical protein